MNQKIQIFCKNTDSYVDVDGGESLVSVARRIVPELKAVCARVNNKTESLHFRVFMPKQVEFLTAAHPSGERTYTRSLCMVLFLAVKRVLPGRRLCIEHSISHGLYCTVHGEKLTPETVAELKSTMRGIISENMPVSRLERLTSDVIEVFRQEGLDDKVQLLETSRQLYTTYNTLDGVADSYYGALVPFTGYLDIFDLVPQYDGMLLVSPDPNDLLRTRIPMPQKKLYKAFTDYLHFNRTLGVSNVGELNRAVLDGHSNEIINVAEALHSKYLARIADEITDRYEKGGARVVLIAGPSSSGKTTTTYRLAIQLMTNLLRPQMISLDNYFVDRHHTPLDETGDYDYESLYALDLELFNRDLSDIIAGKEVALPTYNFQTGEREYKGNKIRLTDRSILLIEGIHGLNPELTKEIDEFMKYRLYVSALTTISIDDHNWVPTTDNRLLRRIIRDHNFRGISAEDTLKRWPSVRRGEEKWIFPYQENADAMFNSSFIFELGVMKRDIEDLLSRVPSDIPEYAEARRLLRFLSHFVPISLDNVPSTSLLREFLGGSSFHY